ncbi:MAG: hypothetical protein JNM66_20180 [Bryobacterales bacterium]|nr:hypothetical protein [Bryobacterales bacterium]
MHSPLNKAEIARRNGALSRGPSTPAGKARSCRNALVHGRRAVKLAEFVPPDSATLTTEDRRKYFALFDQNLSKYQPADPAEKAIVREITATQWANLRIAVARQAMLNRQLANHNNEIDIAYEAAFSFKSMSALRHEYSANARLIVQAERRLVQMRQNFPAVRPEPMDSTVDRANHEPTNDTPAQPVENTTATQKTSVQRIRCNGPLTPEIIKMYRRLHPNCDLAFIDGAEEPAM